MYSLHFPIPQSGSETLDALFAGDLAAKITVVRPITAPARSPGILTPNICIPEKYAGLTALSTAQSPHTTTILIPSPNGMAVLHQFNASLRTNLRTCL